MFSLLMARLFSTWQRPMRIWETGTKDSPKSCHLVTTLTWKCQELSISWTRISLAIPLPLRHALKNSYSLERKKKDGETPLCWINLSDGRTPILLPLGSSNCQPLLPALTYAVILILKSNTKGTHVIALSSRKSQKNPYDLFMYFLPKLLK